MFLLAPGAGITHTTPGGGSSTTNMDGNNFVNIQVEATAPGRSKTTTAFDFTDAATHIAAMSNIQVWDLAVGNTFMNVGTQQASYELAGCTPDPFSPINGTINFPPAPMTANGPYFQAIYGGTGVYKLLNNASIRPAWPFGDCVPLSPLIKKSGWAQPAGNTVNLAGCLSEHTATGEGGIASEFDMTYGVFNTFNTGTSSNSNAGLVSPTAGVGIGRQSIGGRMACVAGIDTTTAGRFYFGVTNAAALPKSDTPLGTGDSGIIVGFNVSDTNRSVRTNNIGGSAATITSLGVAKDANIHRIEINWLLNPAAVNIIFDSTLTSVSTAIPGLTVNLFFNLVAARERLGL